MCVAAELLTMTHQGQHRAACVCVCVCVCRKCTTLVSQIFTLLGAACMGSCVAASAPELLMLGRIFVGVNTGTETELTFDVHE